MDAGGDLIFDRQRLAGITTEIVLLMVWAVVSLALASWRLHAALTRA